MDPELFKQKLSEVAEWELPKLSAADIKISQQKKRGKGRKTNEEKYQEEHEEVFLDLYQGINPTMVPELTKLKIKETLCPDCGDICPEGRRQEIKFYKATPGHIAHSRTRCLECKMYKHPDTGQFNIKQGPAAQTFLMWARARFNKIKKYGSDSTDK